MGDFFGGSSTQVQQLPTLTKEQRKLLDKLSSTLYGQVGRGVAPYSGALAPQATPLQQQWFNLASQEIGGPGYEALSGTLLDLMQPFDQSATRAWWEEAVRTPALETWTKDIVPEVMEYFAGQDATRSGASRQALAESGQRLTTGISQILANTMLQAQQAHDLNRLKAAGMEMQVPATYLNALGAPAAAQYGVESALLSDPYQKWLMSQPWNNPWLLNFLTPTLGTRAFENVITQTTSPGIFGSLLGGLTNLGSAYIMSPYRLW